MLEILSENVFNEAIKFGVTLIDFNAPWCAPCRAQAPILSKIARKFEGKAGIFEINIDENRNIAISLGIRSIPTLILFKNGREIQRFVGVQNEAVLSEAIEGIWPEKH